MAAVDALDSVLVRVAGELDMDSTTELSSVLAPIEHRRCELDLSQVTFTDSTGLNLLIGHRRRAAARGGTLRLVDVSLPVQRLLDITGTAALFLADPDHPGDCPL
ncbi:STAS domain-containing protein [Actinomycetota bacterium Odt1-20B]